MLNPPNAISMGVFRYPEAVNGDDSLSSYYHHVLHSWDDDRAEIINGEGKVLLIFTANNEVLRPDKTHIGRVQFDKKLFHFIATDADGLDLTGPNDHVEAIFDFERSVFKHLSGLNAL